MGEKPLGIHEAPAQMGTIVGGAPSGGVDVLPPAMAAGSFVTPGSNVKSSGSAAATSQLPKGLEPTPTRPGDPVPDRPGPAGMAIKEQGAKADGTLQSSGSVNEPSGATPVGGTPPAPPGPSDGGAPRRPNGKRGWYRTQRTSAPRAALTDAGSGSEGSDTGPAGSPPGFAVKEQGVKYGGEAAGGWSGAAIGPDKPTPTDPGDPFPVDPGPGGDGGMRAGEPIPGADVKLGKNPGGQGDTGPARPEPLPGPSPDRKPIPGIDDAEKKKA